MIKVPNLWDHNQGITAHTATLYFFPCYYEHNLYICETISQITNSLPKTKGYRTPERHNQPTRHQALPTVTAAIDLEQAETVVGTLGPAGQALQHLQVGNIDGGGQQVTHLPNELWQNNLK